MPLALRCSLTSATLTSLRWKMPAASAACPKTGTARAKGKKRLQRAVDTARAHGAAHLHVRLGEDAREVLDAARARRCDHGHSDRALDLGDERDVKTAVLPVGVDRVEEHFASTERLTTARQLHDVQIRPLAPALHCAFVPAKALARRAERALRAFHARVFVRACGGGRVDPDATWIDRDDDSLPAVHVRDLLDAARAVATTAARPVGLGSNDRLCSPTRSGAASSGA